MSNMRDKNLHILEHVLCVRVDEGSLMQLMCKIERVIILILC